MASCNEVPRADIFSQVKEQKVYITELRRHFHQFPELSMKEFKTAEKIEAELSGFGVPCKRVGETGVLGTISGKKSGEGKIIVLRADTDALSIQEENDVPYRSKNDGVMHACGHDGHTAALLGAAKVLAANRDAFSGEVRLAFQQAEESAGGAKSFVEAGCLKDAGRTFAVHMAPDMDAGKIGITAGPINASVDDFCVTVTGKSAHVSTPQKGADALYAACQIVSALQGIVTRRTSPIDTVIIGVGILRSGTANNIIAGEAYIEGTLRTYKSNLRDELKTYISGLCENIAALSGAKSAIQWTDPTSVLVNDASVCKEAVGIAAAITGEDNVIIDRPPSLGGDDFAEFLLTVPGVMACIGCGSDKMPRVALHNCRFDMDESALVYAAGMYACYAAWYLGA